MKNKVDYLRLSITDLCNLNCMYCTPLEKEKFLTHDQLLRYEELTRLVRLFVEAGISKVRITGGEPLVKRNIVGLVRMIKNIPGLEEVSITTNGVLLKHCVKDLKEAGLDRINISLDTLQRDRFIKITGKDYFDDVWQGIESAIVAGLSPVKINVVPIKGVNDDEVADFARLTLKYPVAVRFIEFFHTNRRSEKMMSSLSTSEKTRALIEKELGVMSADLDIKGNGPATYFKLDSAKGSIGFISGTTSNFCSDCSRVRLDCSGKVSPCLFSGKIADLGRMIKDGSSDEEIVKDIRRVLAIKVDYNKDSICDRKIEMSSLGG